MTVPDLALLVAAGVAAGLAGSIAGLASLISYPALLAVGLGPVAANVTNTVALVFSGVGAALGSRPELRGQGRRLRRLGGVAVAGGALGGALLLLTPSAAFERVVPWLIGLASVAILIRPSPDRLRRLQHTGDTTGLVVAVFVIAVYGGYFGAAAGVLLFAVLLAMTGDTLPRNNAAKNAVLALANGVAALGFVVFGPVHWAAALSLGMGFLLGARVGPVVVRVAPTEPLRLLIALAGLALAGKLGVDAYG